MCEPANALVHAEAERAIEIAVGDRVIITVQDWAEGEHALPGIVMELYRHGQVRVRVEIGMSTQDYAVERSAITLISDGAGHDQR
jgi:protein involved in polysaccharide export with SLBB domain